MFFFREWLDHLATSKTQFKKAILLGYSIGHGIAQQALLTSTKIYTNLWCKREVVCYKKYTSIYFYLYRVDGKRWNYFSANIAKFIPKARVLITVVPLCFKMLWLMFLIFFARVVFHIYIIQQGSRYQGVGSPYTNQYLVKFVSVQKVPQCCGYHYSSISFNKTWNQILHMFESCSQRVGVLRWWEPLTMVPSGNKT